MPNPDLDIQRLLDAGTDKTTLERLSKSGIKNVRVIHEDKITELIGEAINNVAKSRAGLIVSHHKKQLEQQARSEFDRLMKEHQEAVKTGEMIAQSRDKLQSEVEKLSKDISDYQQMIEKVSNNSFEEEAKGHREKLKSIEEEMHKLIDKLEQSEQRRQAAQTEVEDLRRRVNVLEDELSAQDLQKPAAMPAWDGQAFHVPQRAAQPQREEALAQVDEVVMEELNERFTALSDIIQTVEKQLQESTVRAKELDELRRGVSEHLRRLRSMGGSALEDSVKAGVDAGSRSKAAGLESRLRSLKAELQQRQQRAQLIQEEIGRLEAQEIGVGGLADDDGPIAREIDLLWQQYHQLDAQTEKMRRDDPRRGAIDAEKEQINRQIKSRRIRLSEIRLQKERADQQSSSAERRIMQGQIDELRARLRHLEGDKAQIQQEMDRLHAENRVAIEQLREQGEAKRQSLVKAQQLELELVELQRQHTALKENVSSLRTRLDRLRAERSKLRKEIERIKGGKAHSRAAVLGGTLPGVPQTPQDPRDAAIADLQQRLANANVLIEQMLNGQIPHPTQQSARSATAAVPQDEVGQLRSKIGMLTAHIEMLEKEMLSMKTGIPADQIPTEKPDPSLVIVLEKKKN